MAVAGTSAHVSRPFSCELCERVYTRQEHLDRHVSAKHTQERDHLCLTCGKRFSRRDILRRHELAHTKAQKNSELQADQRDPTKSKLPGPKLKQTNKRRSSVRKSSVPPLNRAVRTSKACDRCSRSKLRCDVEGEDAESESGCARCLRTGFQCIYSRPAGGVRKRISSSRSGSSSVARTRDNSEEDDDGEEREIEMDASDDDYFEPGNEQGGGVESGSEEEEDSKAGLAAPAHVYSHTTDRRPAPYLPPHSSYYQPVDPTWQQRPPDNFYSTSSNMQPYPMAPHGQIPRQVHQGGPPGPQGPMPHQYYPVPFPPTYPAYPAPPQFQFANPYGPAPPQQYAGTNDILRIAQSLSGLSGLAHETAIKSDIDWSVLQRNPFTPDLNLDINLGIAPPPMLEQPVPQQQAQPQPQPTQQELIPQRQESEGNVQAAPKSNNVFLNSAAESLLSLARF